MQFSRSPSFLTLEPDSLFLPQNYFLVILDTFYRFLNYNMFQIGLYFSLPLLSTLTVMPFSRFSILHLLNQQATHECLSRPNNALTMICHVSNTAFFFAVTNNTLISFNSNTTSSNNFHCDQSSTLQTSFTLYTYLDITYGSAILELSMNLLPVPVSTLPLTPMCVYLQLPTKEHSTQ